MGVGDDTAGERRERGTEQGTPGPGLHGRLQMHPVRPRVGRTEAVGALVELGGKLGLWGSSRAMRVHCAWSRPWAPRPGLPEFVSAMLAWPELLGPVGTWAQGGAGTFLQALAFAGGPAVEGRRVGAAPAPLLPAAAAGGAAGRPLCPRRPATVHCRHRHASPAPAPPPHGPCSREGWRATGWGGDTGRQGETRGSHGAVP